MFELLLGPAGGAIGIVGALIKHGLELFQAKKKADADLAVLVETNKHELAMADKQAALIELESRSGLALAQVNKAKETDVAAYGALAASYDADRATYSDVKESRWMIAVDVVRGFTRPVLTLVFSTAILILTVWMWTNVPAEVTHEASFLSSTFYRLVDALIFLSTSTVGWWFASRQVTKG